jgi:hypothetical protein
MIKLKDLNFSTPKDQHYFSGYYERNIFDSISNRILACRPKFYNRLPTSSDTLEIGYFKFKESNEYYHLTNTNVWNWQQGCMLQWLPNSNDNKIIYNDIYQGKFVSVIFDLDKNTKTYLDMAYYALSHDGTSAFCVDNEHHYWCRKGYHYEGIINKAKGHPDFHGDGIWHIAIDSGRIKKIISVDQLLQHKKNDSMKNAIHFIDSIQINPDDTRLLFFHRWLSDETGIMHTRMYTSDMDGKNLFLLNDSGRMTHVCWRNSTQILGWGAGEKNLSKRRNSTFLRKVLFDPLMPFYRKFTAINLSFIKRFKKIITGDSYILFHDLTNYSKPISHKVFSDDGHPSFNPVDSDILISDQYPDSSNGDQLLFVYNFNNQEFFKLKDITHSLEFIDTPMRSDLHPKWSKCGQFVSIDVLEDNQRSIKVYKFSDII